MFKIYGGGTKFKQWTKDQKLIMSRLPLGAEVLFYNDPKEDEPLVTEVYEYTDENGISFHVCDVPNIFLTDTKRIKVRIPSKVVGLYGIVHSYVGQLERYFEVEPAEKPADYVYEETPTEGCEGQIQADLSQTDSAQIDYVKGVIRQESLPEGYPYKSEGLILDGTFEFADSGGIYMHQITDENFTIVDGKSYTVILDGEVYQCVANTSSGVLALGNLAVVGVGADTGEPFLFGIMGTNKFIYTTDTAATHTITVLEKNVYPIASEFLPDGVKNRMSLIVINAQMPSPARWNSITYGNGKFVAVAESSDKAAYSEDSINWASSTMPSSADWYSVTYGNGKFVAVAIYSDKAAYSEDGINWASSTMPSSARWDSVTYGNGKFVAVAESSDKAAYSEDGINWASSTIPSSTGCSSVTYGNGKFVAVESVSTKAAYSEDGINWASSTMPSSAQWNSVTYGNGKFVAVTRGSSTKAAYSEDGINWVSSTIPSSVTWESVTYGNGKFVAIAYKSDKTAYSEDGINWVSSTMPSSDYWNSVTYNNGKFVAIARGSIQAAHSKDGITWKNTFEYLSQNESDITESVRSVINNEPIVGVPACTTADNGKVLKVVDGVPAWVEA